MSARPIIVGLTGHALSGKDTVATMLIRHGFRRTAFSDELYAEVSRAWHMDLSVLQHRALKEQPLPALAIGMCLDPAFIVWAMGQGHDLSTPRSPRWVVQRWGTEYRRGQDPRYWVRIVQRRVQAAIGAFWRRIVISDVRMANEAEFVRSVGGVLVRVHRPEIATPLHGDTADHESEHHTSLAVDGDLHNDGTLEDLPAEINRVLASHFGDLGGNPFMGRPAP